MLSNVHGWLAVVAAVLALVVAAEAALGVVGPRHRRRAVDRAILAAIAVVAIASLVGLGLVFTQGQPRDPLHFLYATAALVILPLARFGGAGPWERRRPLVLAVAGLILVGLLVRLAQTG